MMGPSEGMVGFAQPWWRDDGDVPQVLLAASGSPAVLSGLDLSEPSSFSVYPTATTDTATGMVYAVVTTSATAPTPTQIKAGQDHTGAAAIDSSSRSHSGGSVAPGTLYGMDSATGGYYVHVVQNTVDGDSNVLSSTEHTTLDANPTARSTGATTGSGTIDPRWNLGTVWWVVTTSATTPSTAQIQAGQDHTGSAAADSGSESATVPTILDIPSTGLSNGVAHWYHYQYESPDNVDSSPLTSNSFTPSEQTFTSSRAGRRTRRWRR